MSGLFLPFTKSPPQNTPFPARKHQDFRGDIVEMEAFARKLRVAALERNESLVDALEREAQRIIAATEKGRKTVNSLSAK